MYDYSLTWMQRAAFSRPSRWCVGNRLTIESRRMETTHLITRSMDSHSSGYVSKGGGGARSVTHERSDDVSEMFKVPSPVASTTFGNFA